MDTPLTDQSIKLNLLTTFFCSALSPLSNQIGKNSQHENSFENWHVGNLQPYHYQISSGVLKETWFLVITLLTFFLSEI